MAATIFADIILVLHVLYVGIVVFSVPLIMTGAWRHWRWVRNLWFRLIHLCMIAVVALESVFGLKCPLTVWENNLRSEEVTIPQQNNDFIASYLDKILFYRLPSWVFTMAYVGFAVLVLSLLIFIPPRQSVKAGKS